MTVIKISLALFISAALSSQAAVVYFDLSPSGTDAAVGLSPSNSVPAVTNSTGSGNAISGGIAFDTDSRVLQLAVGYGSAAGFTDLSGAATAMHIHGPAGPGTNANVLISLVPYNFTAPNPTNGGVIYGNILVPTNVVPNLLAGLTYVNIHTATNPGGEIRGQLIPLVVSNAPPVVTCPKDSTVECGTETQVAVEVSDPEGDALSVVWNLNGLPVHTNLVAVSNPPASTNVTLTGQFPLGTNVVGVVVTDSSKNTAACSTILKVVDTVPPVITALAASPNSLWPPNHKMVDVQIRATPRDACGPVRWKITRVRSSERINGFGDGNSSPDWQITGDHTLKLRAERSGGAGGRVYTITAVATDAAGNVSAPGTVTVNVAHDQGK
jgi:hypothetical protein